MASKFSDRCPTDIPPEMLARVFMTSLRRHQWHVTYVDEMTRIITAELKAPQNIMGKVWHYNYSAIIRWLEEDGFAYTEIEINEQSYDWTGEDCQKKYAELVKSLFEDSRGIVEALDKPKKGARWATPNELFQAGYIVKERNPKRFLVTGDNVSCLSLPEEDTNKHVLVCGPTGSGKTTGVHIPNLIERYKCSALVTEATGGKSAGDLYTKTAGFRAHHGHKIVYFNPDNLSSDRFNPLDSIETYRDARRVVEIIMQSTTLQTHKGDQSWEMSERMLLTGLLLHSIGLRDEGKANLGYIADLFEDGPEGIQKVVADSPIEVARRAYKKFLNTTTPPYRNLVANGIIVRLDLWNEPRIRALTETTDVNLAEMAEGLFTWYLATPADKPELKPLAALMFNLALSFCTTTKLKHPVALFLDEFTNFGYVRGLPDKLTIIRHDKIPIVLGVQDYVQLENLYGKEAKKFLSQTAGKIFFKPNDYETAKQISTMLGDVNKNEDKVTSAGQLRDVKEKEPLLSVDDLLNLGTIDENNQEAEAGKPNMIVFLPATRPVQVRSLTWRDYQTETDELLFPLPNRRVLEVDEKLARTRPKVDVATEEISSEELDRDRELRDKEAVDDVVSTDELDSDTKPKTQENESPGADDNEYGYLTW